jgi:secreted trypsin-like serine protease
VLIIASKGLQAQQRITGGFPINIADAPWQVLLKIGGSYACGGNIVASNFILTAKHCVSGMTASNIQVIAGVTCKNDVNSSNTFNVSRIILHPNPNIDVALLQLSSNITNNNNRRVINYWSATDDGLYDIGNMARVSGWGWLTPNGFNPTDCLQAVDVDIISNQQATNMFNDPNLVVGDHEVATTGVGNVRQGACHGDSGGPLTALTESNEPVLIEVVSWGRPNCVTS